MSPPHRAARRRRRPPPRSSCGPRPSRSSTRRCYCRRSWPRPPPGWAPRPPPTRTTRSATFAATSAAETAGVRALASCLARRHDAVPIAMCAWRVAARGDALPTPFSPPTTPAAAAVCAAATRRRSGSRNGPARSTPSPPALTGLTACSWGSLLVSARQPGPRPGPGWRFPPCESLGSGVAVQGLLAIRLPASRCPRAPASRPSPLCVPSPSRSSWPRRHCGRERRRPLQRRLEGRMVH